ncbi:hypothetical protein EW145_g8503, partial [Phellinidium pouzarii]
MEHLLPTHRQTHPRAVRTTQAPSNRAIIQGIVVRGAVIQGIAVRGIVVRGIIVRGIRVVIRYVEVIKDIHSVRLPEHDTSRTLAHRDSTPLIIKAF